jgi:hypothetical protein
MKTTSQKKANETLETAINLNATLKRQNVRTLVRAHFVDTRNGIQGIAELLAFIMGEAGATIDQGEIETISRAEKINRGMRFDAIVSRVREAFGDARYPESTIRVYLTTKAENVFRMQMTSEEDAERTSPKPRAIYLLVK